MGKCFLKYPIVANLFICTLMNKLIIGYRVVFKDIVLESIVFDNYNKVRKDDNSIKKYRDALSDFFKDVLLVEGVSMRDIKENLEVYLIIHERGETNIEKTIRLFESLKDNRLIVIAARTGLSMTRVSKIITDYLKIQDGRKNIENTN